MTPRTLILKDRLETAFVLAGVALLSCIVATAWLSSLPELPQ